MTPRESYDGCDVMEVLGGGVVIESDRTHVWGKDGPWMARVFALRHPDPRRMVIATDVQFCGSLSGSSVRPWRGTVSHATDAVEAEMRRHDEREGER